SDLDPVRLDVALAGEAELLLDGELHRQAVAVPAGLAVDPPALHGAEPREHVLEHPGLDVVRAGVAVGGRRPFVEGPRLTVGGLPPGLGEGVVGRPELEDLPIDGGQVDLGWYGAVPVGARGAHPGWSFSYGVCRGGTIPVLAGRSAVPPSLAGAMPGP